MPKGLRAQGGPSLRDGQAIAASLVTVFTLHCSVAERRSPLTHPTNPLYTFYMFPTANPSAHSAPPRLCVKIPHPLKNKTRGISAAGFVFSFFSSQLSK